MNKYFKILTISMKNSTTYLKDFVLGNLFIVLIILIYVVLWKNLYGQNIQTGFTYSEIIWYLIINETVFSSNMDLFKRIEDDIKSGNIAYHLNKPYTYPLFILFDSLGKNVLSFGVNVVFGLVVGLVSVGIISAFNIKTMIPILVMMFLGVILNLLIYIALSLSSFWIEENKPFIWVYRQIVFAFGGFLIPITLFPKALYNLTVHMPWTYIAFHTANSAVKFTLPNFLNTLGWQIGYIALLLVIILIVYKKGAERLNVNGG